MSFFIKQEDEPWEMIEQLHEGLPVTNAKEFRDGKVQQTVQNNECGKDAADTTVTSCNIKVCNEQPWHFK